VALLNAFTRFDARRARCREQPDTDRLLHIISLGFQSLELFNDHASRPAGSRASPDL